jgi:hypothetical protein
MDNGNSRTDANNFPATATDYFAKAWPITTNQFATCVGELAFCINATSRPI